MFGSGHKVISWFHLYRNITTFRLLRQGSPQFKEHSATPPFQSARFAGTEGGGGRPLRPRKDSMEHAGQHEGPFPLAHVFPSEQAGIIRHELLPSETRRAMDLLYPYLDIEHLY